MIRIHVQCNAQDTILMVEGKLAQSWASELENCWQLARANAPQQPIRVLLVNVIFIDDKGRALLQQMARQGVELQASGVMTKAIVEEIMKEI